MTDMAWRVAAARQRLDSAGAPSSAGIAAPTPAVHGFVPARPCTMRPSPLAPLLLLALAAVSRLAHGFGGDIVCKGSECKVCNCVRVRVFDVCNPPTVAEKFLGWGGCGPECQTADSSSLSKTMHVIDAPPGGCADGRTPIDPTTWVADTQRRLQEQQEGARGGEGAVADGAPSPPPQKKRTVLLRTPAGEVQALLQDPGQRTAMARLLAK